MKLFPSQNQYRERLTLEEHQNIRQLLEDVDASVIHILQLSSYRRSVRAKTVDKLLKVQLAIAGLQLDFEGSLHRDYPRGPQTASDAPCESSR